MATLADLRVHGTGGAQHHRANAIRSRRARGVAPFAVEIQRRLGSRLRNHLRRIPETELGVARTKRHDELRHTSVALEPPKPFGGFQHASGDPPEDHRAPAPALHVVLHVPGAAEETLDRIRRGQRSLEARGEP